MKTTQPFPGVIGSLTGRRTSTIALSEYGLCCLLLCSALVGCAGQKMEPGELPAEGSSETVAPKPPAHETPEVPSNLNGYDPSMMNFYHLAAGHILIGHKESDWEFWGGYWPWLRGWAAVGRERDEAARLATELAEKLKADPTKFEEMAREHSDDMVTRRFGGHFGVIASPNIPIQLVEAYGALDEGETSRPIETPAGFHIVLRTAVPKERIAWARRLTIKDVDSMGWTINGRKVTRSRAAARALAETIAEKARHRPESFVDLVREHSDDHYAAVDGDMGPMSNHGDSNNVDFTQTLFELPVGGLSGVIETAGGFVVLQRLPDRAVEPLAFEYITIAFREAIGAQQSDRAEEAARQLSERIAGDLQQAPGRFQELRREHCDGAPCANPRPMVTDGSSFPGVYGELRKLSDGQAGSISVHTPFGYLVFRKVPVPGDYVATPPRIFELSKVSV